MRFGMHYEFLDATRMHVTRFMVHFEVTRSNLSNVLEVPRDTSVNNRSIALVCAESMSCQIPPEVFGGDWLFVTTTGKRGAGGSRRTITSRLSPVPVGGNWTTSEFAERPTLVWAAKWTLAPMRRPTCCLDVFSRETTALASMLVCFASIIAIFCSGDCKTNYISIL